VKFRVVLPQFKWRKCLVDLADCLTDGLRRAGHSVEQSDKFAHGTEIEIALAAHEAHVELPAYPVVIYQTEVPSSGWFTPSYLARLENALAVWDAAPEFESISDMSRRSVVAPGLMPNAERYSGPKDIEILFYGSLSERRLALLTKLQEAGLAPSVHFGVFGERRNSLIDRAKLIVDIKQHDGDPNDSTRTFFLDSRGACVLSENDPDPRRVLMPARIVEQCRHMLRAEGMREFHTNSRRADLRPMDVGPAVAKLTQILRSVNRFKVVAAE
jgi:hypothetical protein